jgi:hypothetical protein
MTHARSIGRRLEAGGGSIAAKAPAGHWDAIRAPARE